MLVKPRKWRRGYLNKQLVLSVCPSVRPLGDFAHLAPSRHCVNDEIAAILVYVYLIVSKVILFSAFLIVSVVHHFNTAIGYAYSVEPLAIK